MWVDVFQRHAASMPPNYFLDDRQPQAAAQPLVGGAQKRSNTRASSAFGIPGPLSRTLMRACSASRLTLTVISRKGAMPASLGELPINPRFSADNTSCPYEQNWYRTRSSSRCMGTHGYAVLPIR